MIVKSPIHPPILSPIASVLDGGLPWDSSGDGSSWTPAALGAAAVVRFHAVLSSYSGGTIGNIGADGSAMDAVQAVAGKQSVLTAASTPNGKPAWIFDGTDDTHRTASRAAAIAQPYSIAAVVRSGTTTNSKYPCGGDSASNRSDIGVNNASTFFSYSNGAGFPLTPAITVLNTWHGLYAEYNGANSVTYAGNIAGAAAAGGTHAYKGSALGSLYDTANTFWAGRLCEYIVVNRLLSASERASLYSYFAAEWGV